MGGGEKNLPLPEIKPDPRARRQSLYFLKQLSSYSYVHVNMHILLLPVGLSDFM
jgi:hypothetical protein